MAKHRAQLSKKKESEILALLSHCDTQEFARNLGVQPKALKHWLKRPEIKKKYQQAQREAVDRFIMRMRESTDTAHTTLLRLMRDLNTPAHIRLRATEHVFTIAERASDTDCVPGAAIPTLAPIRVPCLSGVRSGPVRSRSQFAKAG